MRIEFSCPVSHTHPAWKHWTPPSWASGRWYCRKWEILRESGQLLVDFRLFKKDKAAKPPVSTPGLTRFYQQSQSSAIFLLFLKQPSPKIALSQKRRCTTLLFVGKLQCTAHNSRALDIAMQSKEKPRAKRSQVPISHSKTSQLTGSTVPFGANFVLNHISNNVFHASLATKVGIKVNKK